VPHVQSARTLGKHGGDGTGASQQPQPDTLGPWQEHHGAGPGHWLEQPGAGPGRTA